MKILLIAGARPNFVKVAPLSRALTGKAEYTILHTRQHYSAPMSGDFLDSLGIDRSRTLEMDGQGNDLGRVYDGIRKFLSTPDTRPDIVVVVGDVMSTLAAALAAKYEGIKLAHVEAGLRSFDMSMPEEINRIIIDRIADLWFCTEYRALVNLAREGLAVENAHLCGNVMIDSLVDQMDKVNPSVTTELLVTKYGLRNFGVVTIHRPSNVDDRNKLWGVIGLLGSIAQEIQTPLIFPVHPRTSQRMEEFGIKRDVSPDVLLVDPVSYRDMLHLMDHAKFVLTDSGGVQEETSYLKVPCFTLRDNTERPITCSNGTNHLTGTRLDSVIPKMKEVLSEPTPTTDIPLWDGHAAERIVDVLLKETIQ